jgi:hypothetical protein
MTGASNAIVRIGEADRDRCVEQLATHFAAGLLEQQEFEGRVEKALVAKTRGPPRTLSEPQWRPTR